jgi:hypothetical protein
VAGGFAIDEQEFGAVYQHSGAHTVLKMCWVPLHVGRMLDLTVQVTRLPQQTMTREVGQGQVAPVSDSDPDAEFMGTHRQPGQQQRGLLHRDLHRDDEVIACRHGQAAVPLGARRVR